MNPHIYPTEEAAFRRADLLRTKGIWTGVKRGPAGYGFVLLHDPYEGMSLYSYGR